MRSFVRLILFLVAAAGIAVLVDAARLTLIAHNAKLVTDQRSFKAAGLVDDGFAPHVLAASFVDSKGRMLADPPAAADKIVDPKEIVFARWDVGSSKVSSDDGGKFSWPQFEDHLAKATGLKVREIDYSNSPSDFDKIKHDGITILALHAAETPFLVNNYGFQPIAVLGDDSGANGNKLDILVPANSPITSLIDLQGNTLTCTVPSSITGYRAAVVTLMEKQNLRPNIDYYITWSTSQTKSIKGVADGGKFAAAAISDDKLQTLLEDGRVEKSKYKMIYQSEVIPRTTIGWFYNLKPELADKLRAAILDFRTVSEKPATNPSTESSADSGTVKPMHFIPIDYKKDFDFVRRIDDRFDPRFGAKVKG